jgi:hypothetical protein
MDAGRLNGCPVFEDFALRTDKAVPFGIKGECLAGQQAIALALPVQHRAIIF